MTDIAEVTKPLSICGLRREIDHRPQLKFRLASALSEVLGKEHLGAERRRTWQPQLLLV